jgi:hypothetical protein
VFDELMLWRETRAMPPSRNRINFQWKPNATLNRVAIERMRKNFPKPTQLPPHAWFMGSINYFDEIVVDEWKTSKLDYYLHDTGGGIRIFGRFRVWVDWFLYLLPDLILRCTDEGDSSLYESVISFCFCAYQFELFDEYFEHGLYPDIFSTLIQILMQPRFWAEGDIFAPYWTDPDDELAPETRGQALEASMMFCIKYLTPQDIPLWVQSIVEISGEKWREKIRSWLRRFRKMLKHIENPDLYHKNVRQPVALLSHINFHYLGWGNNDICVKEEDTLADFLPSKHITTFLAEIEKYPHLNVTE